MAADKEIMKAIETLRLDRPGRVYVVAREMLQGATLGNMLISTLTELAATYREEAELWAKSGAKGWKGSEAEKYLVAQHIDDVAAQLDNAGGGAALSVSEPERKPAYAWNDDPRVTTRVVSWSDFGSSAHTQGIAMGPELPITLAEFEQVRDGGAVTVRTASPDELIESELRESALRVAAVRDLAGLDALIADSAQQRKGMVRDDLLPDGHPARSNAMIHDPIPAGSASAILAQTVSGPDDVTAYLRGEISDIPGSVPLTPGSVTSAPEADDPFAKYETLFVTREDGSTVSLVGQLDETLQPAPPYCRDCDLDQHRCYGCGEPVEHGKYACAQCELIHADGPASPLRAEAERLAADPIDRAAVAEIQEDMEHLRPDMPKTWESDTMTADGFRIPGTPTAPLLGQPGDAGTGYSHDYIPAGGRRFTYAELLTPVPATSLPAHLSHSQGNTIGDCATKYRLQRVEALPQVPQWANVGGSAFHAAVEAIEREEVVTPGSCAGDRWNVDLMWKHHFEEQIRLVSASSPVPVSVWRTSRKGAEGRQWWEVNGPLMLRRYLDARPSEPTSNLPAMVASENGSPFQLAIELDLTADVPTPYGPIPFNAKLDRVTNVPQEVERGWITLMIRDYKTSYERPTNTTQLGDYANVLRLWGVPESVKILGTYFDARRGEWTPLVDLLAEHPFDAFAYRVTIAHAQKRALTTGPTPARPSSYCGGCSVRYACPIMASRS